MAACEKKAGRGGDSGHFVASIRAAGAYAEKYGGFDVAKSEALRDVRDKSISVANEKLSENDKGFIGQYTSDDYYDVNAALRGNGKLPKDGKAMVAAVSKMVDEVGDWKQPATIYHGVKAESAEEASAFVLRAKEALSKVGVWEEKAILSTSASRKMSEEWAGKTGVLMRIQAKRGALISTFTGLSFQQEIVQKPGTKYRVKEIK